MALANNRSDFMWANALVFSRDFTKLYMSLPDPEEPAWYTYDVSDEGGLSNRRLFPDAKHVKKVIFAEQ